MNNPSPNDQPLSNAAGTPKRRTSSVHLRLRTGTNRKLTAAQIIIIGFFLLVFIGGLLLTLPISSQSGSFTSFEDAMFTSVSAGCVTGLTVQNTGAYWSLFGQIVIIILIQVGGLGFMTLAVMLSIFVRRQITPRERVVVAQSLGLSGAGGMVRLVKRILLGTLIIEGSGAAVLASQFIPEFGVVKGIGLGLFHSISAFCNAGFDLLDSLNGYRENYVVGITLMLLIVLGGIGFIVWDDVVNLIKKHKRMSVYSRIVIITTVIFIVVGALFIAVFEWNNPETIGNMPVSDKIFHSFFQSITTRTAGFDIIMNYKMTDSAQLVCLFLMLIGGASGSCAGGVKVGSFAVIVLAVRGFAAGKTEISVYNRRLSSETISRAMTIFAINLTAGATGGLLVSIIDRVPLLSALYETISAISTVGLSLALSPELSLASHIIVMLLMFFGRVGILTVTFSIMLRQAKRSSCITYPDANMLIG